MTNCFLCNKEVHEIQLCDTCNDFISSLQAERRRYNKLVDEVVNDFHDTLHKSDLDHEITEKKDHIEIRIYF